MRCVTWNQLPIKQFAR